MERPLILDDTRADESDGALRFSHEHFISEAPPEGAAPGVIDVTGRPRVLFTGPARGMKLARGLWRATAHLELCPDAAQRFMALEFGVEPNLTVVDLKRGVFGPLVVRLDHSVAVAGPMQLSLRLKKPAFHGYVKFHGAIIEKIADHSI